MWIRFQWLLRNLLFVYDISLRPQLCQPRKLQIFDYKINELKGTYLHSKHALDLYQTVHQPLPQNDLYRKTFFPHKFGLKVIQQPQIQKRIRSGDLSRLHLRGFRFLFGFRIDFSGNRVLDHFPAWSLLIDVIFRYDYVSVTSPSEGRRRNLYPEEER